MSRRDDYSNEMFDSRFADEDIELLLSGGAPKSLDLAELATYLDPIRAAPQATPTEDQITRVASQAAAIARSTSSTGSARRRPDGQTRRWSRMRPQVAVSFAATLVVFTIAGAAVASDGAAPGDTLYGLDRAMERWGVGDGGPQERIAEASSLLSAGNAQQALTHAVQAIDPSSQLHEMVEARSALVAAAAHLDDTEPQNASLVGENVSALLVFIEESIHDGAAADNKEFGQRVATIAREISTERDTPESADEADVEESNTPEPAENPTGPPVSVPGNGAIPPAQGGIDNSGGDEPPGNSGNAGGNRGSNGNSGGATGNGSGGPPFDGPPGQGRP